jgi:hypothetical protein
MATWYLRNWGKVRHLVAPELHIWEPRGQAPPSAEVPVPLLVGLGQAPKRKVPVPNSMLTD